MVSVGVFGVLDDVDSFILLLDVLQHQMAQRVDVAPRVIHHLARSQQNHLGGLICSPFEHNLTDISRRDIDVDVLSEEGGPVFLFDW